MIRSLAFGVGLLLTSGSAFAACTISEHWDFQGQTGTLQDNDYLRFTEKGSAADKHLPAKDRRTYWDSSWYNKISSVQLSNNCKAVFFMTPDNKLTGHQVIHETTARLPEELNDKTHGLICDCQ